MHLFRHDNRRLSGNTRRLYARYELVYTLVDFLAALSFLLGSILFFWNATEIEALWLFVIGSLLFMLKPTIRLVREVHMYRVGYLERLAARVDD